MGECWVLPGSCVQSDWTQGQRWSTELVWISVHEEKEECAFQSAIWFYRYLFIVLTKCFEFSLSDSMICATKSWIITTITLSFVCLSKPEYDDSDEDLVVPCCWSLQEDFDNAAAADRRSYCLLTICLDSHHWIELHCVYSEALTPMKTHLAVLLIWARTIWKRTLWLEFKNFGIKFGDTFAPLTIDSCLVNS